jgi:hypothetical protein
MAISGVEWERDRATLTVRRAASYSQEDGADGHPEMPDQHRRRRWPCASLDRGGRHAVGDGGPSRRKRAFFCRRRAFVGDRPLLISIPRNFASTPIGLAAKALLHRTTLLTPMLNRFAASASAAA